MTKTTYKVLAIDIRHLIMLSAILCAALLISGPARSQFAPDACDPNYYESLESRAWLEAQREITQNQNLIFKPDSVLEYTCFDRFLRELVAHEGQMFSGNSGFGFGVGTMGANLSALVGAPISSYQTANFNHTLLGGRSSVNAPLSGSISGGSYTCDRMNTIWRIAKCMDFIDDPNNDGFFTFAEYAANADRRTLPTACPNATAIYNVRMDLATANDPATSASGQSTPW
ncbi:MAG: hypothetical protein AAF204_01260 [Pseudomonadota bacterium]